MISKRSLRSAFRTLLAVSIFGSSPALPQDAIPPPADRTTFAFDAVVRISAERPTIAKVRWSFAGIDEIRRIRIELDGKRFRDFESSGELERRERDVLWRPNGPYGHLEYEVRLRHRRSRGKGFDSYATKNWVLTRAQDLFPRTHVTFELDVEREPRSRSTVRFVLPRGWQSYTAMDPVEANVFRPFQVEGRFARPKGWIALGRYEKIDREIAGLRVAVVTPPASGFPSAAVLDLYERTLPTLVDLFRAKIPYLLLVSGPDPMWRGGLSGERSLYLHAERPTRTPDETSPAIHEAFHVLAPFRPGKDARWLSEGLAEYYSLVLQRRAGAIDEGALLRGLGLWRRYGRWNVNLSTQRDLAVTNNAAPFVLAAIEEWIGERTHGERNLDDVVRAIVAMEERTLTTAIFLRAVKQVAGSDLTPFVQRHVYAGVPPTLRRIPDPPPTS